MRFKDLQEGKRYKVDDIFNNAYMDWRTLTDLEREVDNNIYILHDGILCHENKVPTELTMMEIKHLVFEKMVEFVDFHTAFDAMVEGKICSFYNIKFSVVKGILHEHRNGTTRPAYMSKCMLNDKKWVILD